MPMTLKLENDAAVLQDGKPVYVTEDGQDFVADVPSMHANILKFKANETATRKKLKEQGDTLKLFDGVEDLEGWHKQATEALETVKNLDDKKLVDAGKVEQVKREVKDAYEGQVNSLKKGLKEAEANHVTAIEIKDRVIHKLTVGNRFASDPHFSGPKPLTNLPPDVAEAYYGHHFKVVPVDGKPDEVKVVGYLNGNEILSTKPDTIGEIADFDEAIKVIIDQSPHKERIMAPGHSGSSASGGEGGGGGAADDSDVDKLQKEYDELVKAGRGREAIAAKNRLFKARQAAAAKQR